ncbi:MAG: hypothetical protein ACRYFU_23430 [Janthinobacterium lividum]
MERTLAHGQPTFLSAALPVRPDVRDAAAAEVAAIRKATAARINALKTSERRLRALDIRDQKRRENHAKILVGVAMIHQCQSSEASATKFKGLLEEFYSDSPDRLKNAFYGLSLVVKKPSSDLEQD